MSRLLLAILVLSGCQTRQISLLTLSPCPISIDSFTDSTRQVPVSPSVLSDSNHFVWGGSVVKGSDGRYHMFYSIFDKGKDKPPFGDSWLLSSKIAYAVSDFPDHGFHFVKIILRGAAADGHPEAWDAQGVHNPHIKEFNGKYYLYYIGSHDPGERPPGDPGFGLSKRNRIQQVQTVSVIAVNRLEDLINGRFTRPGKPLLLPRTRVKNPPVIDPSPPGTRALPDNLILVNPTVVYRPSDRKYLLYFKGNWYDPTWRGVHGVAIGDRPDGPFVTQDEPVFSLPAGEGKMASAEDPYVWYHPGSRMFYAVFKDFNGRFTGSKPGLAMMISKDGINWEMHPQRMFAPLELPLTDGSSLKVSNLERPQFLIGEDGVPVAMYAACSIGPCGPKTDGSTFNVQFRIVADEMKSTTDPDGSEDIPKTFADHWKYIGIAVEQSGYVVWGTSPITGPDGKTHLFVARWPGSTVEPGWRSNSEIAHYVGDRPEGPFTFSDVALTGTGRDTWDKASVHNPTIHKVGNRFVLLYIGNNNPNQPPHPANQCIGMAVSDNLYGPWKRVGSDGMILAPPKDSTWWNYKSTNGVNNPAFLQTPDGRFFLYFKSQGSRMGLAIADRPEGPYRELKEPVTRNNQAIEDGYAFMMDGKYCLLTTDNHGIIEKGGGILWKSSDGIHFDEKEPGFYPAEKYLGKERLKNAVNHYAGNIIKFERPQLLLIKGKPAYLYGSSGYHFFGGPAPVSYVLKYAE